MKKVIVLSLLIICGILFTAQIKRGALSLLILIDVVRSPEKAVMGRFLDGPTVTSVMVPSRGRQLHADLYRSDKKSRQFPLLLVHGVNETGKDDKQLVLLAKDLARAGFLVLVPDLEGVKTLRIRSSDTEDILQSFLYLIRLEQAGTRGGMMGISYGSGPMLLAAADHRIRDRVSMVVTFGGYYDLRSVLLYALTGAYGYGGHSGHDRPDASLRWMFVYRNLDLFRVSSDREKLRKIIEKRNQYELAAADALARSLSPEGKALYDFIVNTDQEKFMPLYEMLPVQVRDYVYQLSPERAAKNITASFIITHGTDDYSIPYTESMKLADSVGDSKRMRLALLPQFMHVEPVGPSAGDWLKRYVLGGWRLFGAIYDLLEKGDGRELRAAK